MMILRQKIILLISVLFLSLIWGCRPSGAVKPEAEEAAVDQVAKLSSAETVSEKQGKPGFPKDKAIPDDQSQLLDLAFQTATMIPVDPHIKDRSKAQQDVVSACLELDQPGRARAFLPDIENWRQGAGDADLAVYLAEKGYVDQAREDLERAREISLTTEDWRRDRIEVKMARAHRLLGQADQALRLEKSTEDSQAGPIVEMKIDVSPEVPFAEQTAKLDTLIETGEFELVKSALRAYILLFDRHYDNPEGRASIETQLRRSWKAMPSFFQTDLLMNLAEVSIAHSDQKKAGAFLAEARRLKNDTRWQARYVLPVSARLAELRYEAGETQESRKDLDAVYAEFQNEKEKIINIDRAGVLRSVAEAYQKTGAPQTALSVYKEALEQGMVNPNSRPRAEDLSATCLSMALSNVEPDQDIMTRIRQIKDQLKDPW